MLALIEDETVQLSLPRADDEVLPGVPWGRFDQLFTPAFWRVRAWYAQLRPSGPFRIGENLTEEIVACLLGGHGLPAEIGVAAFLRLKRESLLYSDRSTEHRIRNALRAPLYARGRWIRYRYPNQRARFVVSALQRLAEETPPLDSDLALREWLTSFNGIGLKTASWITRNVLGSDNVAILDIHIIRAGVLARVFTAEADPVANYRALETRLIEFATALQVRLSILDSLIWTHMRVLSGLALQLLATRKRSAGKAKGH